MEWGWEWEWMACLKEGEILMWIVDTAYEPWSRDGEMSLPLTRRKAGRPCSMRPYVSINKPSRRENRAAENIRAYARSTLQDARPNDHEKPMLALRNIRHCQVFSPHA